MNHALLRFGRRGVVALIIALLALPAMIANSQESKVQDNKGQELSARKLAEKPVHTTLKAGDDERRIEVKFLDGTRFDVNAGGNLIERPQNGLRSLQSRRLLANIVREGGRWHRLAALSEELMDQKQQAAQRKLGRQIADMNSYYVLTVPERVNAETWIDLLNSMPEVEIAQPVPLPAPMPLPGDYQSHQGYLDAATAGIDAESYAWGIPGGTGANVRIVDLEYSWNLNHDDLPAGITTLIPGGRTAVDPFSDNDHGTAVLGELASLNNGWGTTGIAHAAQIFVAPVSWDNGYNLAAAITNAIGSLGAGDIMLIEQQTRGPNWPDQDTTQFGLVPSEWQKSVFDAIVVATGNGIHVVEAAGNGSQNLDAPEYSVGNGGHYPFNGSINSGAIIVGAGARPSGSTTDRSRLSFSCYGARVNVQGWGEGVMTTGYGNYFSSEGMDRWYTGGFSGTSSASPIVTGAVALIESIEEQLHGGTPITPAAMRTLLINTGSPQQAGINPVSEHIGPRPSIRAAIMSLDPCDLTCPADVTVSNDLDYCGAVVNYTAPTAGATCGPVTTSPVSGSFFPVGTTTVYVTTTSGTNCSFNVTVNDTQPPSITCPADIVVGNDSGYCGAVVNFSAMASDNCPGVTIAYSPQPGSFFPKGTTVVTCTATDAHNNSSQCQFNVTVNDVEPPSITMTVSPTELWPPNHTMHTITASVQVSDNCPGVTYELTSITSNEPDNGLGDGDTPNDIQDAVYESGDLTFKVRAERSGLGTGRIYSVTYTAIDGSGNETEAYATVTVPFDMEKTIASDIQPRQFSLAQNYPNPFNPTTMISFDLPAASVVTLRVFDALGREVATVMSGDLRDAGRHEVAFDGSRLGSGIYSYTLTATSTIEKREFSATRQMVLMK